MKFFKAIAIILCVIAVGLCGLIFLALWKLPSPAQLRESLKDSEKQEAGNTKPVLEKKAETRKTKQAAASPKSEEKENAELQKMQSAANKYFLDRYLTSAGEPKIEICAKLRGSDEEPFHSGNGFLHSVVRVANGENPGNPYVESVFAPITFALNRAPSIRELFQELKNTDESHAMEILKKAKFYSKFVSGAAELLRSKEQIEAASDNAYNLFTLTRAIHERPQLLGSAQTDDLCRRLENNANAKDGEIPRVSNQEILAFLKSAELNPEDVGYDPNYKTNLKIERDDKTMNLRMRIGWMDALLSNEKKKASPK